MCVCFVEDLEKKTFENARAPIAPHAVIGVNTNETITFDDQRYDIFCMY